MLERDVEKHLVKRVKAAGGIAYKFTSPGRRSVPDRLVLMPPDLLDDSQRAIFVELKAPGKTATPAQLREHGRLRDLGFRVEVIDTKEGVDAFMLTL